MMHEIWVAAFNCIKQKKESENVQKNTGSQKIVQWECCDNNQHEKNEETAETK